jgi:histidinol dehydrogenase
MIPITKITGDADLALFKETFSRCEEAFEEIDARVKEIMENVKKHGDDAVLAYTEKFDAVRLREMKVTPQEIGEALATVDPAFLTVLERAKARIATFHEQQMEKSWFIRQGDGILLGQLITPLQRVGVYVPGGKAVYPSTVLMNVIPARVAGVEEVVMTTPPDKDGKIDAHILAAAHVAGVTEIYKVGGAQAIAALTYGTETIRPVDKIVGPGNVYVARAKKWAFGKVDVDMIAGPSEIGIVADETADPAHVAADLLSQAEHDQAAVAALVTDCRSLAEKVKAELERQLIKLDRQDIAKTALETHGHIFVTDTIDRALELVNEWAPEHLELMVENPFEKLVKVKNAGAIFLGPYTPVPVGDYIAGPNHTLPTNGTARFSSPLGTYDFIKRSSVIYYDEKALKNVKNDVILLAEREGLTAHARAIGKRFET